MNLCPEAVWKIISLEVSNIIFCNFIVNLLGLGEIMYLLVEIGGSLLIEICLFEIMEHQICQMGVHFNYIFCEDFN